MIAHVIPETTEVAHAAYRLGVDIGGTFTDIVLLRADGTLHSKKLLSSVPDFSRAIEQGIGELLAALRIAPDAIEELVHATTVATNALIERKGVNVALVTTQGFRDVLELARFRAPRPYDLLFRKPDPLVPRHRRFEVPERTAANGDIVLPLDRSCLTEIARCIREQGVEAVAVCFINSYANDRHEREAADGLSALLPGCGVTRSTSLLPQLGEYERTSTAVVNAYLQPVVSRYVHALDERLRRLQVHAPLMVMQSAGGIATAESIAEKPITIIESGPAAGVLGAQRLGERLGLPNLIVFDMGGTTAKATIIEEHRYNVCPETEVGGGINSGQRIIKGGGYPVQVPTIDIAEVGAGGGSIAYVDQAGGLRVGPHSAGADPGPACYNRGGSQPTVTDANLLLGYLNPRALVSGELALDAQRSRACVGALSERLGIDPTATAYGVHCIADAAMLRALHGVSSERGQDPARFALFAIGGSGPVHATSLAESAGMRRIIVPPVPGLYSALGLLFADVEHQLACGFYRRVAAVSLGELNAAADALRAAGEAVLGRHGFPDEACRQITICADMKYVGQTSPLAVTFAAWPVTAHGLAELVRDFEALHQKTFGYVSPNEPMQFVALKAVCRGRSTQARIPKQLRCRDERSARRERRNAYFGPQCGWIATPVMRRGDLTDAWRDGPLIIEEYDATTVVRPGWRARLGPWDVVELVKG